MGFLLEYLSSISGLAAVGGIASICWLEMREQNRVARANASKCSG